MDLTPVLRCAAITAISLACLLPASAQQTTTTTNDPQPRPQQAAWAVQCRSDARTAPLSCSMEQRIVARETGQQVARLQIQVPAQEPATPTLLVHLPLGLAIPDGVTLAVDDGEPVRLAIRTCDAAGCYASGDIPAALLDAFGSGKQIAVGFQNLQGKPIKVNFTLTDFADSYARIQ